jgi:hypothetical protein
MTHTASKICALASETLEISGGEPVDVRSGLLGKGHVWAIISSVGLEMDEIKKENESWREAKIVTKAAHLGLALQASHFSRGSESRVVPGQTTPSNCRLWRFVKRAINHSPFRR